MSVIIENKNGITVELDCSSNPNYPALSVDNQIKVTVAGRIGGGSGPEVEAGDVVECIHTNLGGTHAAVGAYFLIVQRNTAASTEATPGFIAIASLSEANAETDDTKAITSLKLKARIDAAKAYADSLITTPPASDGKYYYLQVRDGVLSFVEDKDGYATSVAVLNKLQAEDTDDWDVSGVYVGTTSLPIVIGTDCQPGEMVPGYGLTTLLNYIYICFPDGWRRVEVKI